MICNRECVDEQVGIYYIRFILDTSDYPDREAFPSETRSDSHVCLRFLNKRSPDGVKERYDDLCVPFTRDASLPG